MLDILNKLLQKRGVKYEELDTEEKKQFDDWKLVLTKEELSVQDIKDFCQSQVDYIESKWADLNSDESKKAGLIPYHTVYKLLLKVIESPRSAREGLAKNLTQLL